MSLKVFIKPGCPWCVEAVAWLKREGYSWSDLSLSDLGEVLRYPGFHRLAFKYAGYGFSEMLRSAFVSLSGEDNMTTVRYIS